MRIRRYSKSDIPQISRIFYNTVRTINAQDYSADKIRAWAPKVYDDAFWKRGFRKCNVLVAEEDGLIIGFAAFRNSGFIDYLFVHHQRQRRGVGLQLIKRVEKDACKSGISRLFADVSITAEPVFRKAGFRVVRRQKRIYRNRSFTQFRMQRNL